MEDIKATVNEHIDQVVELVEKLSTEIWTGFQPAYENFIGFFHAINGKVNTLFILFSVCYLIGEWKRQSRDIGPDLLEAKKVWYSNVPHTRLVEDKGAQNWITKSKDKFKFPGVVLNSFMELGHTLIRFHSSSTGGIIEENGFHPPYEFSPDASVITEGRRSSGVDGFRNRWACKRLEIPINEVVYGGMSKAELSEACEKEMLLSSQDRLMEQTKDKRNALEAFIYDTRSKVIEQIIAVRNKMEVQLYSNMLSKLSGGIDQRAAKSMKTGDDSERIVERVEAIDPNQPQEAGQV